MNYIDTLRMRRIQRRIRWQRRRRGLVIGGLSAFILLSLGAAVWALTTF